MGDELQELQRHAEWCAERAITDEATIDHLRRRLAEVEQALRDLLDAPKRPGAAQRRWERDGNTADADLLSEWQSEHAAIVARCRAVLDKGEPPPIRSCGTATNWKGCGKKPTLSAEQPTATRGYSLMTSERYEQIGCTLVHEGKRYWSIMPRIVEPGGEVWRPVFVRVEDPEPERLTYDEWLDTLTPEGRAAELAQRERLFEAYPDPEPERCPTCGSDDPRYRNEARPDSWPCPDPWHGGTDDQ